jgi:hypothetical protein
MADLASHPDSLTIPANTDVPISSGIRPEEMGSEERVALAISKNSPQHAGDIVAGAPAQEASRR